MADDVHARLGALAREASSGEATRQAHLEGRARLIAAVERERAGGLGGARGRFARWAFAAAATAAALAIAAIFLLRARPIGWTVDGGGGEHAYVVAPAERAASVRFDDGSEVSVLAGGRARVASTSADGAELLLEEGRADVHVVHRARTRWRVLAGPYTVVVTGTRFEIGWSGARGALQVAMREGSVRVSGPGMAEGIALAAPQVLEARASDGALAIGKELAPTTSARPPSTTAQPAESATPPPSQARPPASTIAASASANASASAPSAGAATAISWSALVAGGKYGEVLAAAKPLGASALERSLADVQALADAARLGGDPALAERALLAIRRRFPGTGDASTAAFLIGRLAEEQQRAPAKARQWYDRYLAESPGGAFASDALGRKMLLVDRLDGRSSAAPLARDYLARFPKGAYAKSARAIAGAAEAE